jgi:hypothetical protein
MSSSDSTSGEWLDQDLTAGAGLVVRDNSVAAVESRAEKYVRAFKAVIRSDILECLPSASQYLDYALDIEHRYFRHGTKGTDFVKPVEVRIRVRFGEK